MPSATGQYVAEGRPEVTVQVRVDARVDPRRQVTEPRECREQTVWNATRLTQSVGEVRAEEWQPQDDKSDEDPNQGPFCSPLAAVDLDQLTASATGRDSGCGDSPATSSSEHVDVHHRPRTQTTSDV